MEFVIRGLLAQIPALAVLRCVEQEPKPSLLFRGSKVQPTAVVSQAKLNVDTSAVFTQSVSSCV